MGTMMGGPDERHKTMRPQIVPPPTPSPARPRNLQIGFEQSTVAKKLLSRREKYLMSVLSNSPSRNLPHIVSLLLREGSVGLSSRFLPHFKILRYYLVKTCHAIDNILGRDLGFFSHLCLPVGSVGGGRVCDEPASTLPSLCSSLNKGIPAFQKSVGCFRFYTAR